MKSSSWKKFLSVVLLLTMVVSMLPCAAFAEEAQPADEPAATEQTVKTEETKDEVKNAPKSETKDEVKDAPKSETKDEAKDAPKDETKDEAKDAPKDETKDEAKDAPKSETKDEAKDAPKEETKDEVKDEAEEYSEAVKAFLAAAEAINVPEDISALSEDEIIALLAQIDTAGACYEKLSEEEQALDAVTVAVDKLSDMSAALNEQLVELLEMTTGETQTVEFKVLYVDDSFKVGYSYGATEKTTYICQYKEGHTPTASTNHAIAIADIKAASARAKVDDGYSIVGWTKKESANPKIESLDTRGDTACTKNQTIFLVAKKPVNNFTVNYYDEDTLFSRSRRTSTSGSIDVEIIEEVPTKDGYTFLGWTESKNGEGNVYNFGDKINVGANQTKKLYAQWKLKEQPTTAKVIYHVNGGIAPTDPVEETVPAGTYTIKNHGQLSFTALNSNMSFLNWAVSQTVTEATKTYGEGETIEISASETLELWAQWFDPTSPPPAPAEPDWENLEITKSVDWTFAVPGDEIIYTITVTNNSDVDLTEVIVEDHLSDKVTYVKHAPDSVKKDGDNYTIETLGAGSKVSFTITARVNDRVDGDITNVAKVLSANGQGSDPRYATSNEVTTTVGTIPVLSITKSVDKAYAMPDEEIKYTITVLNNAPVDLTDVVIYDELPSEVTYKSHTVISDNSVKVTREGDNYTIATLGAHTTVSFTITAKVNVGVPIGTTIENVARVSTAKIKDRPYNLTGTSYAVYTTVGKNPWLGLSITKTVDKTTAQPGDTLTYTITVKNDTGAGLNFIAVRDTLPAGVELVDKPNSSLELNGTVEIMISSLAAGAEESFTITVKVLPDAPDFITNTAAITEARSDSEVGANKDILKDKTASATTEIVKPVTMPATVTVKFVGLDAATMLPAGYTLTGADTNELLKGSITPLTKDETAKTYTYTGPVSVVLGKEYTLNFNQTGYEVEGYTCDAAAAVTKTVTANEDDMEAGVAVEITLNYTKGGTRPVDMPVTVTVNFVGLDAATKLPTGYTLTGADANELLKGSITPLTKDETAKTYTYTGNVSAVPGKVYNLSFIHTGFAVDGYICTSSANPQVTVTADKEKGGVVVNLTLNYTKVNWAGLKITKTADKTYATPGSYVKYTITVTNNTCVDLTNVNVLDYLPDEVRYSSSFGGYDSGASTWTIARLADGKSATVTIRVRINSGLSTGTKIENTAYVTEVTVSGQVCTFENRWLNSTAVVTITGGKGAPKTGDESNLGLWIAVMAASLACAGAAVVVYKKRRTGND